jgi:hypothetical protein
MGSEAIQFKGRHKSEHSHVIGISDVVFLKALCIFFYEETQKDLRFSQW